MLLSQYSQKVDENAHFEFANLNAGLLIDYIPEKVAVRAHP